MDFKALVFLIIGIPVDKSRIDKNAKYSPSYKIYTKTGKRLRFIYAVSLV
ncbi:MAG: hypothetical protein LE178_06730 [Endomicrobium sp.]|jgi:hypothetical protein|nr:hypothetical protein [Endomicrobium sp.]